jgi:hypothetical protein
MQDGFNAENAESAEEELYRDFRMEGKKTGQNRER